MIEKSWPSISMMTPFFRSPVEIMQDLRKLKFFGRCAEHLGSPVGQQHQILDPHAAFTRNVHAGFNTEYHAGSQLVSATSAGNPGWLVDLESNAVAQPVAKRLAEACGRDVVAGDAIHILAGHARTHADGGLGLGLVD